MLVSNIEFVGFIKRILVSVVFVFAVIFFVVSPAKAFEPCEMSLIKEGKPVTVKGYCGNQSNCAEISQIDPTQFCLPNSDCGSLNPNMNFCWVKGEGYTLPPGAKVLTQGKNVDTAKPVSDKDRFVIPNLNVDIPGLSFTTNIPKTTCQGRAGQCVTIPFLAEYITALYKYALGLGLVAAAIMFMYGAFLYLVGATGLQIQSAKQKMVEAILGLTLLLASYAILANVAPSVVSLKPIEVDYMEGTLADIAAMTSNRTNPTDTSAALDYGVTSAAMPESCPFILTAKRTNFFKGVLSKVTTGTFEERLQKVAEYTVGCKMNLLDCGTTVTYIMALAGAGDVSCLLKEGATCSSSMGRNIKGIFDVRGGSKLTMGYLCTAQCPNNCCKDCKSSKAPACEPDRTQGCQNDVTSAKDGLRDFLQGMYGDEYPNKIADQMKPGDWVWTYTANKQCDGLHSSLFVKWIDQAKGTAVTLEGQILKNVSYKNRCFKTACSKRYEPIIRIMRINPKILRDGITMGSP